MNFRGRTFAAIVSNIVGPRPKQNQAFMSMGTGKRHSGLCPAEIVICLAGLVASVVPLFVYSDPFFGLWTFVDKEIFDMGKGPSEGVLVKEVEAGSPLASAGVRKEDRLVRVNGKPVDMDNARQLLRGVQAGEPVTLDVIRDGKEQHLKSEGEVPRMEAAVLLDWQFVTAPLFLLLLVLLIATQPLNRPLWRAILVAVSGLGVLGAIIGVELTQQILPWTPIWRSSLIRNAPAPELRRPGDHDH